MKEEGKVGWVASQHWQNKINEELIYWNTSHWVVQPVENGLQPFGHQTRWPSVTWMWPMQSCLFTLSNILVLQKEQVWLNWHRQGVEESKAGWIWSPHPKFCWFQTSVQPWPAARPLVPGCADTTHSLQFPPKEAEMANIIACNSFLACQGVNLWD